MPLLLFSESENWLQIPINSSLDAHSIYCVDFETILEFSRSPCASMSGELCTTNRESFRKKAPKTIHIYTEMSYDSTAGAVY